jgi:hypothetical protein
MPQKLLKNLFEDQTEFYKIKGTPHTNFKNINYEMAIYSLMFIIHYLEANHYTLTHICLDDFVIYDNVMFLKKETHLVEIKGDYFSYESIEKHGIEFSTKNKENRIHKSNVYESIAYFIYYVLLRKVKNELTEEDMEILFETKPYFFIKNAIQEKCLIYI